MKKPMKYVYAVVTAVALAGGVSWISRPVQGQQPLSTLPFDDIATGYKISPVPITLGSHDPFLVGWGSYLVNAVGGCNDCHTNPSYADGGDPFQGQKERISANVYLGGGQEFGPFVSRNLTPEANGLPAGLTFDQFQTIMTTGVDLDKLHPQMGPLLQVMPWPGYSKMNARELRAIYEYLSTIPPVKVAGVPGN
jgi:hypothetical protein